MFFSIIIVSYNTKELTANCLNSIFGHCRAGDFEIIVVDNNSDDGSARMLNERFGGRVKTIFNDKNSGFGAANNRGAKIARGEFLFFLNSDTIVSADILTPFKEFFDHHAEAGMVAPKLLLSDGRAQPHVYGNFSGFWKTMTGKLSRDMGGGLINDVQFETDWVSGAAMVIRKTVFEKIGGFDDNFFMYFEDIDLCRAVKNLGYKIYVYPAATVTHLVARSSRGSKTTKKQYYRSQNYYFKKHYGRLAALIMRTVRFPYKRWRLFFSGI